MRKLVLVYLLSILGISNLFAQEIISKRLMEAMNTALENNTTVRSMIMLQDQVDIVSLDKEMYAQKVSLEERAYTVITLLQEKADRTQPAVVNFLNSKSTTEVVKVQRFWITNMLMVEAIPAVLMELSTRNDVAYMDLDARLEWDQPVDSGPAPQESPNGHEIGLERINAHVMWRAGFTGEGRIVMNDDTGVDGNHPALSYKWRGAQPGVPASAAWFDPIFFTTFPNDGDIHGTHTMGTMCGLQPSTNDTVGVAPGAQWIASNGIMTSPHTSTSIAAWQWAINPDNNPGTIDDMPDAIGNSWYDPAVTTECNASLNPYINASNSVEAAGIAIIFSAGNNGPGAQTCTSPKNVNLNEVSFWATGAVDGNNASLPIASFSSRGPVTNECTTGIASLDIKPEASAPGVSVRSSIPGSSYSTLSGTSMACPHVVGAIALLREAHPTITGHEAKMALYQTARDLGTPGEDNTFGMGIIDVWAAHLALADPLDPKTPTDFAAYSDYTTPTSMLLNWEDPTNFENGDTLLAGQFTIEIERDGSPVASVAGGLETYTDMGLNDGQLYDYSIYSRVIANDSTSNPVDASWIAGGSPIPGPPTDFYISEISGGLRLHWINPTDNADGTPMDDFAAVRLYEDGALIQTFSRTPADTGAVDSTDYTPPAGTHFYYLTAVDNEIPANVSVAGNTAFTPVSYPFSEGFEAGLGNFTNAPGNGANWVTTTNYFVGGAASAWNAHGNSQVNVLELNGSLNLATAVDPKLTFYQICKLEGDYDFGYIEYSTDGGGTWLAFPANSYQGSGAYSDLRFDEDSYPIWGTTSTTPLNDWWQLEIFDLSSFVGQTNFKIRFRLTSDGSVLRYGWLLDNIYIGPPTANPLMAVAPQVLMDTLLVGATSDLTFTISNNQLGLSNLDFTITEDPVAGWISVTPENGTVGTGGSLNVTVTLDATGLATGTYTTDLIVTGNDTTNTSDTVAVTMYANDAPVIAITPDSLHFALETGQVDSQVVTISNTGAGPLNFTLTDEDLAVVEMKRKVDRSYLRPEFNVEIPKGTPDWRVGTPQTEGAGGPDLFGYKWIDSDEPGGPTFSWVDISATGTPVTGLGDDAFTGPFPIGFTFSYYGADYTQFYIASNGFLGFGPNTTGYTTLTNAQIPTVGTPNNIVPWMWDDLNPATGGFIYYQTVGNQLIVQFVDYPEYGGTGTVTAEVILNSSGSILYQYLAFQNGIDILSSTVGIENINGDDGLQVVYNAAYLHDNLAIKFAAESEWLSENPNSGTILPGGSMDIGPSPIPPVCLVAITWPRWL